MTRQRRPSTSTSSTSGRSPGSGVRGPRWSISRRSTACRSRSSAAGTTWAPPVRASAAPTPQRPFRCSFSLRGPPARPSPTPSLPQDTPVAYWPTFRLQILAVWCAATAFLRRTIGGPEKRHWRVGVATPTVGKIHRCTSPRASRARLGEDKGAPHGGRGAPRRSRREFVTAHPVPRSARGSRSSRTTTATTPGREPNWIRTLPVKDPEQFSRRFGRQSGTTGSGRPAAWPLSGGGAPGAGLHTFDRHGARVVNGVRPAAGTALIVPPTPGLRRTRAGLELRPRVCVWPSPIIHAGGMLNSYPMRGFDGPGASYLVRLCPTNVRRC